MIRHSTLDEHRVVWVRLLDPKLTVCFCSSIISVVRRLSAERGVFRLFTPGRHGPRTPAADTPNPVRPETARAVLGQSYVRCPSCTIHHKLRPCQQSSSEMYVKERKQTTRLVNFCAHHMSAIGLIALVACPTRVELHAHRPTPVRHRSRRPVAIAIQGDVVMSAADTILRRAPYASAFAVVGVKAVLADLLAQTRERRLQPVGARVVTCDDLSCEEIEVAAPYCARRTLAFLLYGGIYQGCFQHWLFNRMLPALVGEGSDLRTVLSKVAVDQLILTPFLCLPAAYLFKVGPALHPPRSCRVARAELPCPTEAPCLAGASFRLRRQARPPPLPRRRAARPARKVLGALDARAVPHVRRGAAAVADRLRRRGELLLAYRAQLDHREERPAASGLTPLVYSLSRCALLAHTWCAYCCRARSSYCTWRCTHT